jgi:hypothetical protein
MAAIAKYGRIPVKRVREVLDEAGVARRTPQEQQARVAQVLADHGDEIVRRYNAGESGKSLGGHYGISPSSILSYLDEHGVKRRTPREALLLMHQQRRATQLS